MSDSLWRLRAVAILLVMIVVSSLRAQDHTVLFNVADAGVNKAVTNWGMGTIGGYDVMQSGIINMGADEIDVAIMPFTLKDPVTNGEISADSKALLNDGMTTANLAGANKPVIISAGNDPGAWYHRPQPGESHTLGGKHGGHQELRDSNPPESPRNLPMNCANSFGLVSPTS